MSLDKRVVSEKRLLTPLYMELLCKYACEYNHANYIKERKLHKTSQRFSVNLISHK